MIPLRTGNCLAQCRGYHVANQGSAQTPRAARTSGLIGGGGGHVGMAGQLQLVHTNTVFGCTRLIDLLSLHCSLN